jgi:dTMP kinase
VGALSRRRWFALSIVLAGGAVVALALAPRPMLATLASSAVGCGAGMAFLSGTTLLGGEVDDAVRGRVFAFVHTAVRITLMLSIALSGLLVGVGASRRIELGAWRVDISTTRVLLFAAGACGVLVGLATLRQIDDRQGVPIMRDLFRSLLRRRTP